MYEPGDHVICTLGLGVRDLMGHTNSMGLGQGGHSPRARSREAGCELSPIGKSFRFIQISGYDCGEDYQSLHP